jgi:hypothetical protein
VRRGEAVGIIIISGIGTSVGTSSIPACEESTATGHPARNIAVSSGSTNRVFIVMDLSQISLRRS